MSAQEEEEKEEEMQEATPIELFYDLFFVANLTTVTGVHYITENQSKIVPSLFFFFSFFPNIILLRFGILQLVLHHPVVHMAARHTLGRALFRGLGVRAGLQVDSFHRYGRLLLRLDHMESSQPGRAKNYPGPQNNDACVNVFEVRPNDSVFRCNDVRADKGEGHVAPSVTWACHGNRRLDLSRGRLSYLSGSVAGLVADGRYP